MRLFIPIIILLTVIGCGTSIQNVREVEYSEAEDLPCHILLNSAMTIEKISVLPDVYNASYRDNVNDVMLDIDVLTLNDTARVMKAYTNRINMIDKNIDTFYYDIKYVATDSISGWIMKTPEGKLPIQFAATDSTSVVVAGKVKFSAAERDTDVINNVEEDIIYMMKNIRVK